MLDKPGSGGDTLFVNTAEAYKRLSPPFRERLHGLKAVDSGIEQVEAARSKGSIVRRDPVANEHPVIRTHPITGDKAIYVNPQCKIHLFECHFLWLMTNLSSHTLHCRIQERGKRCLAKTFV